MQLIRPGTVIRWYGPKDRTISIENEGKKVLGKTGDDKRLIPWLKSKQSFYKLVHALALIHELLVDEEKSGHGTSAWKFY
ncbi:MAG: hypothetical protein AAB452_02475 [Patescibacteria group bacterium]